VQEAPRVKWIIVYEANTVLVESDLVGMNATLPCSVKLISGKWISVIRTGMDRRRTTPIYRLLKALRSSKRISSGWVEKHGFENWTGVVFDQICIDDELMGTDDASNTMRSLLFSGGSTIISGQDCKKYFVVCRAV